MLLLALKMLINDRAKYWGLVVGITFATLLICQQLSIYVGALSQTVSLIRDVGVGEVWVSRKGVETIDFSDPLRDTDLFRVRGVEGVRSAVPLYVGSAVTRTESGKMRQVMIVGLDDATLIGAPGRLLFGEIEALRKHDAVIVDTVARKELFAGRVEYGSSLELNRQRVEVVGLCQSSPQFSGMSLMYARRSVAARLANEPNYAASWFLVETLPGHSPEQVAERIRDTTGLQAKTREVLSRDVIAWFAEFSGITEVLGLAIILGVVVGTVIVGQTFYMFAVENLRYYAAMKAIGLGNIKLLMMLFVQAGFVGAVGLGLGLGLTAMFFTVFADEASPLRGMGIPPEVAVLTSTVVMSLTLLSALLSAHKVLTTDPAIVFKA